MTGSPIEGRLVAVAVAVLFVATAPAVAGPGSATAAGEIGNAWTATATGELRQTDAGDLLVEIENESVNGTPAVTVAVDGTAVAEEVEPEGSATLTYRVPAGDLPDRDLDGVNVTVTDDEGERLLHRTGVDLRHVSLADDGGDFTDEGGLSLPVESRVGVPNGTSVELTVRPESGDAYTVSAEVRGASATISRSGVEPALESPGTVVVADADGGVTVAGETTVPLVEVGAAHAQASRDAEAVALTSPLLLDGVEYAVVVRTTGPDGRLVRTATAEGQSLGLTVDGLASADEVVVEVVVDGKAVVSQRASRSPEATGEVQADGTELAIEGFDAGSVKALWVETATGTELLENVSLTDAGVNLSDTGTRFAGDGGYLVVVFTDAEPVVVRVGDLERMGTLVTQNSENEPGPVSGSLLPDLAGFEPPFGLPLWAFVVALGAVLVLLGAVGYWLLKKFGMAPGGGSTAQVPTGTLAVEFVDDHLGEAYGKRTVVKAVQQDGDGSRRLTVEGGSASKQVPTGRWSLQSTDGEHYATVDVREGETVSETVRLPPVRRKLRFVDAETSDPVSDVDVSYDTDYGTGRSTRTAGGGTATLVFSPQAESVELEADHEGYETRRIRGLGGNSTVRLTPLTGSLAVGVSVDGTGVPGVEVTATPRQDWIAERDGQRTATTDDGGTARFDDLPVGDYRVDAGLAGEWFRDGRSEARVEGDSLTRAEVDVAFEFDLSPTQRRRLDELRQAARGLGESSRLDTAIQRYYGGAIEDVLDVVEGLPDEDARFATTSVPPGEVADALLDAAAAGVDAVETAMGTKHNVDLFSACSNLSPAGVEPSSPDAGTLFSLLAEERVAQRSRVREKLREVERRIDEERGEVATLSPASELHEEVAAVVRNHRDGDELRMAATAFVALALLGAVEELFAHRELRKRLEQTVF